mmetsp:Transcript_37988/g.74673  ORF Transcript_37988/g.74673 Transcript_37988/m.74673 type:complete len:281 (+) Transcript_37988:281-1123(+)
MSQDSPACLMTASAATNQLGADGHLGRRTTARWGQQGHPRTVKDPSRTADRLSRSGPGPLTRTRTPMPPFPECAARIPGAGGGAALSAPPATTLLSIAAVAPTAAGEGDGDGAREDGRFPTPLLPRRGTPTPLTVSLSLPTPAEAAAAFWNAERLRYMGWELGGAQLVSSRISCSANKSLWSISESSSRVLATSSENPLLSVSAPPFTSSTEEVKPRMLLFVLSTPSSTAIIFLRVSSCWLSTLSTRTSTMLFRSERAAASDSIFSFPEAEASWRTFTAS